MKRVLITVLQVLLFVALCYAAARCSSYMASKYCKPKLYAI